MALEQVRKELVDGELLPAIDPDLLEAMVTDLKGQNVCLITRRGYTDQGINTGPESIRRYQGVLEGAVELKSEDPDKGVSRTVRIPVQNIHSMVQTPHLHLVELPPEQA